MIRKMYQKNTGVRPASGRMLTVLLALFCALSFGIARADQIGMGRPETEGMRDAALIAKFQSELERALKDAGVESISLLMSGRACPDIGCWAARARAQGVARFILPAFEGFGSSGFIITVKVYDSKNGTSLFRERVEIATAEQSELQITKLVALVFKQLGGGSSADPSPAGGGSGRHKAQVRILGLPPGRGVLLNNIPVLDPTRPVTVEAGRQRLVVSTGDQARSRDFDVLNNEIYTIEFVNFEDMAVTDQSALTAVLELRNVPTDARVKLDGAELPRKAVQDIQSGTHSLLVERAGYEKMDMLFTAKPGQQVLIPVAMTPLGAHDGPAAKLPPVDTALLQMVGLLPVIGPADGVLTERVMDAARYAMEQSGKIRYQAPEAVGASVSMTPEMLRSQVQKCVTTLCVSRMIKPAGLGRYVDVRIRQSGNDWVVKASLLSAEQGDRVDDVEVPYGGSVADLPWIAYDAVRQLLRDYDPVGMSKVRIKGFPANAKLTINKQSYEPTPVENGWVETGEIPTGIWMLEIEPADGPKNRMKIYLRREMPYELDLMVAPSTIMPAVVRPQKVEPPPVVAEKPDKTVKASKPAARKTKK